MNPLHERWRAGPRFRIHPIALMVQPVQEDERGMVMDIGLDNTGHGTEAKDPNDHRAAEQDTTGSGAPESDNPDPRPAAAPDSSDPRELARDWLTLWQSELAAMAADVEIRESWQTIMALWAGTVSTLWRGLSHGQDAPRHDRTRGCSGPADATRASAAAAAPDARDAEIKRLARNVAALERRLAELERSEGSAVHSKGPPKRRPARKPEQ